jgi:hypothetical protein
MASVPFNNLITFSRGSNATLTGPTGLIQWAPNNLVTNSEQFDNAAWTKSNSTVTANAAVAPDGTSTADKLVEAATTSSHYVLQAPTVTATTHVFSVYAKAGERSFVSLGFDGLNVWFNLTTGAVGTIEAGLTAAIVSVGDGWYRCSAIRTVTVAGSKSSVIYSASADNALSYTGNGTSGIFIWGAQLELGSAATTYNSTTVKNLLGFSEAFDNAAWTKSNASIVTGAQANPVNGAFNAQKLMEDTSTNLHRVSQVPTLTAAAHTASIYAKSAGRNWLYMANASLSQAAYFNLNTGTIGTIVGAATATITPAGNGWYRCSITSTPSAGAQNYSFYTANADASFSYTGDGNSGVYIYGAQLSDSASLDPYVPTPAAAPSSTAYYGPRFDYDPVTLAPKGLLVEEARTNLLLRSQEFDNASWAKFDASVAANTTVAPDGTNAADTLIENTANATHFLSVVPNTSAGSHTFSVFYKIPSARKLALYHSNTNTGRQFDASGNQSAGLFVAPAGGATVTSFGNGWYRATITVTTTAAVQEFRLWMVRASDDAISYTGDGVSGVFLWGAQLEAGAFATSYIPTVASTVTRSADVATINGSLFSQWYGQTEGTFVVNADSFSNATTASYSPFTVSDGTSNNRIEAYQYNGEWGAAGLAGGSAQFNLAQTSSYTANTPAKIGIGVKLNDFAVCVNGLAALTDTSGVMPTVNRLELGRMTTANYLNGHIRSINFIPARAADFQLQALTS